MNLKTTPLLFGLMLGILWLFGLMLVYKKGAVDENLIVPTMQGTDTKVDSVKIVYNGDKKDKTEKELVFQRENDRWFLVQNGVKVRVEGFRIDDLVRQIKDAKRYEEERVQDDLRYYSLPPAGTPRMFITLKGHVKEREKTWTFNVGNTSAGEFTVYVNSSDRPGRAYPVVRSQVDALFFKDTADLRPKRLFDTVEPTVTSVLATDGKDELELKKVENSWRFIKPPLGFAGFEAPSSGPEDKLKEKDKDGGVKGLITAITTIRVESEQDFEPPGARSLADYGLEAGKETMRLALGSGAEKKIAKKDDEKAEKEENREVLLIGKRAAQTAGKKGEVQYYARMLSDDGVFRVNARQLEPIKEDVRDPKRIRSRDVVSYDPKKVDAVVMSIARPAKDDKGKDITRKEEVKLLHAADKDWQVDIAGDKQRKGNEKAIQAFIAALEGKKEIKEFADDKDAAWGGLNGPSTTDISVYIDALEKEKDKKKDEKDKKKKDEKKAAKEPAPTFKKDVKPFVKLIIGKVDKEQKTAYVKRILQDGTESRFTVPYAYIEKLHLDNGALAFVDTALPSQSPGEVIAVDIQRGKDKVELDRNGDRWTLRDIHDPLGGKLADRDKMAGLIRGLTSLIAKKWVKKDDADKLGLKNPELIVSLFTKNEERLTAAGAGSLLGATTAPGLLPVLGVVLANRQADRGDRVTIKFGKEIEEDKQKLVYVEHSGIDLIALVPAELVKQLKDLDLRDRSAVAQTEGKLGATLTALAAEPTGVLLPATPLGTGVIHRFEAGKVKEVTIALRTKVELRSFTFKRIGKEKTWEEVSGVKEFQVDTDKVMQLLEQVCKLKTNRFASFGGPTGDSKLTTKEAMLRVELTFEKNSTVTLTVGAPFGQLGYFAHSSAWPEAVFFVPTTLVDPWMHGAGSFGKERATAGL